MSGRPWRRRLRAPGGLAAGVLLLVGAASPPAGAPAPALDALTRVRVTVDLERPVEGLAAGALRGRLAEGLQRAAPPIVADDEALDRLRVRVAIEPRSATDLRGFWLPFSGTYAIGLVGLALERPGIVTATDRPATVIVWREDRVVAVPWRAAAAEVRRAADAMLEALLAARRAP